MPTSARKQLVFCYRFCYDMRGDYMDLPQRKRIRLTDFDYNTPTAYFITVCTQDRKPLLSEIVGDDAHIVPKPYGNVVEKYIRRTPEIEKYVIMPDHIHMIIRLTDETMCVSDSTNKDYNALRGAVERDDVGIVPYGNVRERTVGADAYIRPQHNRVSSIVRSIKTLTTKEIGVPIFQRSYYDHVIRNQRDYDEIWEYIEGNPSKWLDGKMDDT